MEQTMKINGLEITKFLGVNVDYGTAVNILKKLGDRWRFPTLAEFFEIKESVTDEKLAEWFGTNLFKMTDFYVQSINDKEDINLISLDGVHLSCNILRQIKERGLSVWLSNAFFVRTDISERAFKLAQRYANEASEEIKRLLKSHNIIGLDFNKYRGKCRIEDYDYIVKTDYDFDDNSLYGIYLKDDKLYVADSNGGDLYLDSYRCDLEVELYDLVKNIFEQIDKNELEIYEYPEDNI